MLNHLWKSKHLERDFSHYKTLAIEDVYIQYCIYVHKNIPRCPTILYFGVSIIVTVNS